MISPKPLNTVLKDMNLVNKVARKSGLKASKLKGSLAAAARLSTYFGITKTQVYLLSATFFLCLKKIVFDLNDVGSFLEMDEGDLFCLLPDFNVLVERRFLYYSYRHYMDDDSLLNKNIKVAQPLTSCIVANQPIAELDDELPMDIFVFVREVSSLVDYRSSTACPSFELYSAVKRLEKEHSELEIPGLLIRQSVNVQDRILFYKTCHDVACHSITALVQTSEEIYDNIKSLFERKLPGVAGAVDAFGHA